MSGHFLSVLTLLCSACGGLAMCTIQRYPTSVEEWYNCVPCPPPRNFSLLCSQDSIDCTVLIKLLEVCLSQYNQYYQQWFTDEIKCVEKHTCLNKRPSCGLDDEQVFQNISDSCITTTTTTSTTTTRATTTTPFYTRTTTYFSTTTPMRTTQTTNDHVTNVTESLTTSFIEMSNDTTLTISVTAIPQEPPSMEPKSYDLLFIIIGVVVTVFAVFAAVVFAFWKVKKIYYVNFESPLYRQTSTDSRSPIIRTEKDCSILCVLLKHRVTSHDNGYLTSKEIQKGYYNHVPGVESQTVAVFQNNEIFEEDESIKANCDDELCEDNVITNDVDRETRI
ncbi:uncharacterized protein LOC134264548 isoform X4 [Saccostrea cucullata]|uniref:uncharacterized protein LOC134264548 isoform X4 n=1 Tax=Saccostrea cuccullata TaxID=36930 RepID=UPI002ED23ECE